MTVEMSTFTVPHEDGTDITFEVVDNKADRNPLKGKKVSFIGDSICVGANDDTSYLGGYGKIIAERNNMEYENLAKGGATITAETYSSTSGIAKPWICRMVDNMSEDADYAIVEGGVNDAWQWDTHGTIAIGEISNGFSAELDDTTYYGAFESMLKKLVTKFQGKKIGYIAVPKMMELYDSNRNMPNFYHIALECCAKWGVPVCDLNTIVPPFEYIRTLGTEYTVDGTHPTYEGYLKYYCDPIEAWMKTLTTGGSVPSSNGAEAVEVHNNSTESHSDIRGLIRELQNGKLSNIGVSFRRALLPLADGTTIEIDVLTAVDGTLVIPYVNRVPISIDTDGSVFNDVGYMKGYRLSSSGATKALSFSAVTGYIPATGGDIIRIFDCGWVTNEHASNYICAYDTDFNFIGALSTKTGYYDLVVYTTDINGGYVYDENNNAIITLKESANIAYIRVSSRGVTAPLSGFNFSPADMIVTVNEEIAI